MPKRLDAQDTVDTAIHLLQYLASDGWCMESLDTTVGYAEIGKKSAKIPTHTTLIIRLRPVKE